MQNRPKLNGKGMQNRLYMMPYQAPPFYRTWKNQYGMGNNKLTKRKEDKKRKRSFIRPQFTIQKRSNFRSNSIGKPNFEIKPISKFDIIDWLKYLKVTNFNKIISRDEIPNNTKKDCYIVNLDDRIGQGSHWIVMHLAPKMIYYFDVLD